MRTCTFLHGKDYLSLSSISMHFQKKGNGGPADLLIWVIRVCREGFVKRSLTFLFLLARLTQPPNSSSSNVFFLLPGLWKVIDINMFGSIFLAAYILLITLWKKSFFLAFWQCMNRLNQLIHFFKKSVFNWYSEILVFRATVKHVLIFFWFKER